MPGPDVQQLPGGGPDAIFSLCLSIVFCLDYPMLPYAFSFYWHFVLRPLHFIFFLGGVPPPRHHTGIIYGIYIYLFNIISLYIYIHFSTGWMR